MSCKGETDILRIVTYERAQHGCKTTTSRFQPAKNQSMWQLDYDDGLYTYQLNLLSSLSVSPVRDNPQ
jgi:hypothetical protein